MGRLPLILLLLPYLMAASPVRAEAPPVEFGLDEFRQALREKKVRRRIRTEITTAEPGSYRISAYRIQGGDLRGLMYGLIAAADQIRRYGRLVPESGKPAVAIRGIRRFLHNEELESVWYHSREYWREYIQMLARNRLNRLNLVFAHQTNYLAPPYPHWLSLEEFPEVRADGVSKAEQKRNLATLCYIAQTAADHAIDFTLGIWQHDYQHGRQTPTVSGLNAENIGPYSYQALKKVLAACPAIRSVQVRTNSESGIPAERQVGFYRDYVYRALKDSGRLVTLDLRGWLMSDGMLVAALDSGVPMRLSSKYWAEHLGRPYQPAETVPNYSYINFLRRWGTNHDGAPRPYDFFWEIWALGSHRLLLWGDPDYVRRAATTLTLSDSKGFEIDEPLAQKGYGNRPGQWGIFAEGEKDRRFWKWDFERYWMFYRLWGRLTYDPKVPEGVWMNELEARFGEAAADVLAAYRQASGVLSEIVAVNMPDPNMYMWPEINPGGLIGFYAAVRPSTRRFVASIPEAVRNVIEGHASAKQTPRETAAKLRGMSAAIDEALRKVRDSLPPGHAEWRATEPDFQVLSRLARFHAHRQLAAEKLTWFYQTSAPEFLEGARVELAEGLRVWEDLVELTDGLYPPNMVYGPADYGHWKDKLPYLRHDLETVDERAWLFERFGRFAFGFDFGGAPPPRRRLPIRTSLEPRFRPVDPETSYSEERGYGWATEGERGAVTLPQAAREMVRATAQRPRGLPENALFGDSIHGQGAQTFRVRTGEGEFLVSRLSPDGNAVTHQQTARNGVLDIVLPAGAWNLSGLIVKNLAPEAIVPVPTAAERPDRPALSHTVPRRMRPGRPLSLTLRVTPATAAEVVRLHYRPLNALEKFRTLEAPAASATFTIPAESVTLEWDLLYYFEVLAENGSGWFHPDPEERTPYYVIQAKEAVPVRRR